MGRIDHIAIVVEDLDKALEAYEVMAGKPADLNQEERSMGMRSAYLRFGAVVLELIQPLGEGHFITTREGIHHIALRVRSLKRTLARLRQLGVRTLDDEPSRNGETLSVFVDPRDTGGVMMELTQGFS